MRQFRLDGHGHTKTRSIVNERIFGEMGPSLIAPMKQQNRSFETKNYNKNHSSIRIVRF